MSAPADAMKCPVCGKDLGFSPNGLNASCFNSDCERRSVMFSTLTGKYEFMSGFPDAPIARATPPQDAEREVLTLQDFTEQDIAEIKNAHCPEETKAFDHEMDAAGVDEARVEAIDLDDVEARAKASYIAAGVKFKYGAPSATQVPWEEWYCAPKGKLRHYVRAILSLNPATARLTELTAEVKWLQEQRMAANAELDYLEVENERLAKLSEENLDCMNVWRRREQEATALNRDLVEALENTTQAIAHYSKTHDDAFYIAGRALLSRARGGQ